MTIYLDHAATSPLRPEARAAFLAAADAGGNASSIHAAGRRAKLLLEEARAAIEAAIGATGTGTLTFTSGGGEANALALRQAHDFDYIVVSQGEHDSLYLAARGTPRPVVRLNLTPDGQPDLDHLREILARDGRPFVCGMLANNETGVITDVARIAELVHARDGWLHVDAVQALGKIAVDFPSLAADSLSLSAHKIGGGQGVGAFVNHRDRIVTALLTGTGQEKNLRAGTENIPGIAAFAAAVAVAVSTPPPAAVSAAQAEIEAALKALGVAILGEDAARVPGVLCIAQPDWPSSLQLIHTDMAGICVSSGAACSSGKVKASRVASAMGFPDMADKVLRISSGWTTQAQDWQCFYDVWSAGYAAYLKRHAKEVA